MSQTEPFWQWWDRMTTPPAPEPEPPRELTLWEPEKARNRLARRLAKVESGRWVPRRVAALSGEVARELAAARTVLADVAQLKHALNGGSGTGEG
jgi:hypothetical protein